MRIWPAPAGCETFAGLLCRSLWAFAGVLRRAHRGFTGLSPQVWLPLCSQDANLLQRFFQVFPGELPDFCGDFTRVLPGPGDLGRAQPGDFMSSWSRMRVLFRDPAGQLRRIYQALWPGCGESTRPQHRTPSIASPGCGGWRQGFMGILQGFSWASTGILLEVYRGFVRVLPDLEKKDLVLMYRQLIKWLLVLA